MGKNRIKVISKGYTLTCVSWENDADNYKTRTQNVEDKDYALALKGLILLSDSKLCHKGGLGNATDWTPKFIELVKDYIESNTVLNKNSKSLTNNELINFYTNVTYPLLSSSEFYKSRVCESIKIFYSPEDMFLEEV